MALPLAPLLALAGQGINAGAQIATNRAARHHARQMYIWQRTDALSDWHLQNQYDHPSSQMARLREAGLNPNLVYGKGADNTSGAIRSSSPQAYNPQAPRFDSNSVIGAYYDTQVKQAQIDNLRVANTVAAEEAKLKQAQVFETTARTAKTALDTSRGSFELDRDRELRQTYVDTAMAQLQKLMADIDARRTETDISLDRNDREAMANAQTISESIQRIIESRVRNLEAYSRMESNAVTRRKMEEEILNLRELRKTIEGDSRIKAADAEMKERGQQPTDPAWQRWIGRLWDKLLPTQEEADEMMRRHRARKNR